MTRDVRLNQAIEQTPALRKLVYDGAIQPWEILPLNSVFWRRHSVDNWVSVFAGMYTRRYMPAANNAIHQPSQPDKSDLFEGLHKVLVVLWPGYH